MKARGIEQELFGNGIPWKVAYRYARAVQVCDTNVVSGQLSHDDAGNLIGRAPVDASGRN